MPYAGLGGQLGRLRCRQGALVDVERPLETRQVEQGALD